MIGPTPKMSVSDVPDAVTASVMRALDRFNRGVEDADLVEGLVGELEPLTLRRVDRLDRGEELIGLCDNDFLADPTRHQLAHQRVQPATRPAPGARRVELGFGQQPQHRHVILAADRRDRR